LPYYSKTNKNGPKANPMIIKTMDYEFVINDESISKIAVIKAKKQ